MRFLSPASPPDQEAVYRGARELESWGLKVDFGEHAFRKFGYLAGNDEQRLQDFNAALADPSVRAIFATRGGKGSYRIADRLDFQSARKDPKFVVGFNDITVLLLTCGSVAGSVGVRGALRKFTGHDTTNSSAAPRSVLMTSEPIVVRSRADDPDSGADDTWRQRMDG